MSFSINTDAIAWKLRLAAEQVPTHEKVEDPIQRIIQDAIQASCTIFARQGRNQWTGSGFHVGRGLIITAGHVAPPETVSGETEIFVTFDGQSIYPAQTLASEPRIDAAILNCPEIADRVPGVILGDSDSLEIGEMVAVIGSPEGFHDTATVGRISNLHQGLGPYAPTAAWNDIIMIDAKILEGVSGGMLIATDGKCYGSVMGVTGQNAQYGVGENAVCPANKIKALLMSVLQ